MFSRPIVFVVGAGASAEFNLIDGRGLNAQLAKTLNFGRQDRLFNWELPSYSICFDLRFKDRSSQYHEASTTLAQHLAQFVSIDEALHWYSSEPERLSSWGRRQSSTRF